MKKQTLFAAAFAAGTLLTGAELIPNGSFEENFIKDRAPNWYFSGKAKQIPGLSGKAVEQPASIKVGSLFKATFSGKTTPLKAGKYLLSGAVKGDMNAIWIVMHIEGDSKNAPLKAWLGAKKLTAPDKDGWRKFAAPVEIKADCKYAFVYFEPFVNKAGNVALDEIKLTPVNE